MDLSKDFSQVTLRNSIKQTVQTFSSLGNSLTLVLYVDYVLLLLDLLEWLLLLHFVIRFGLLHWLDLFLLLFQSSLWSWFVPTDLPRNIVQEAEQIRVEAIVLEILADSTITS